MGFIQNENGCYPRDAKGRLYCCCDKCVEAMPLVVTVDLSGIGVSGGIVPWDGLNCGLHTYCVKGNPNGRVCLTRRSLCQWRAEVEMKMSAAFFAGIGFGSGGGVMVVDLTIDDAGPPKLRVYLGYEGLTAGETGVMPWEYDRTILIFYGELDQTDADSTGQICTGTITNTLTDEVVEWYYDYFYIPREVFSPSVGLSGAEVPWARVGFGGTAEIIAADECTPDEFSDGESYGVESSSNVSSSSVSSQSDGSGHSDQSSHSSHSDGSGHHVPDSGDEGFFESSSTEDRASWTSESSASDGSGGSDSSSTEGGFGGINRNCCRTYTANVTGLCSAANGFYLLDFGGGGWQGENGSGIYGGGGPLGYMFTVGSAGNRTGTSIPRDRVGCPKGGVYPLTGRGACAGLTGHVAIACLGDAKIDGCFQDGRALDVGDSQTSTFCKIKQLTGQEMDGDGMLTDACGQTFAVSQTTTEGALSFCDPTGSGDPDCYPCVIVTVTRTS